MISYLHNYIDVATYAKRCGVPSRTIHDRLKKGYLKALRIGSYTFINSRDNPPIRRIRPTQVADPVRPELPDGIFRHWLFTIRSASGYLRQSEYEILRQIILGKLDALIINDLIFVHSNKIAQRKAVWQARNRT